jgi:fatty-acyl-CoA synthase
LDIERFAARFGCTVSDGYGSTEGGASVSRVPGMPAGALGVGTPGTLILDQVTGAECPPARFDEHGHLLNPDEAIGELVNERGAAGFEGYYNNDEANRARVRDGKYWTGDLAYRDEQGFVYFAGRDQEWLRVDGENIATAPIERILQRHPDIVLVSVYGVPDVAVGDQVMAAVELLPGATFDGAAFGAWIDSQPDLGPVWAPRFIRLADRLPVTETSKVLKRVLQRDRWDAEGVWWREEKTGPYRPFTAGDRRSLERALEARTPARP